MGRIDRTTPKAYAHLAGDTPTDDEPETRGVVAARAHWLNTNAFHARFWALDVQDNAAFGIEYVGIGLEPLTLTSMRESQELEIEVATSRFRIADAKMYACSETTRPKGNSDREENYGYSGGSGGSRDGVDGYQPDRWKLWKGIAQEVTKGNWRTSVIRVAQAALGAKEKVELETLSQ